MEVLLAAWGVFSSARLAPTRVDADGVAHGALARHALSFAYCSLPTVVVQPLLWTAFACPCLQFRRESPRTLACDALADAAGYGLGACLVLLGAYILWRYAHEMTPALWWTFAWTRAAAWALHPFLVAAWQFSLLRPQTRFRVGGRDVPGLCEYGRWHKERELVRGELLKEGAGGPGDLAQAGGVLDVAEC